VKAYQITSPDGKKYRVEAPDNATLEDVKKRVSEQHVGAVQSTGKSPGFMEQAKNAAYGFAARGNEAINTLNPFKTDESNNRILAEKEWVKQHPGADYGVMAADMAITSPAAAATGGAALAAPMARTLATAGIEGLTSGNTRGENLENAGWAGVGAGLGEGAASALGYLARPFAPALSNATRHLVDVARQRNIPLNAAQVTGSQPLKYADRALDFIPSSSGPQQAFKDQQRTAWQRELLGEGNQIGDEASQQVMSDFRRRTGDVYTDIAARNNITVDQPLKDALGNVADTRNLNIMDANQRAIVEEYLRQFNKGQVGSQISGQGYQNTRSMLDKQAKSMRNTNPAESESLRNIRNALDEAMNRSVSPADSAALRQNNRDYMVMKSIQRGINPTTEEISPNLLINELTRKNPNSVIYGQGDQSLNDIAKVGKEFISQQTPNSGTAQISKMIALLTGAGAAGYGSSLASKDDMVGPLSGTAASVLAAVLLPRLAGQAMRNPKGYLVNGLVDMGREAFRGGPTRQRALAEALRNAGTQTFRNE
jgi:hypothetical protein